MPQLGFDEDGDPIDLPPTAVGWRVRHMTGKRGAPGLVYGSNGVPLVIPLEMDIDELRREVGQPGRYRLEPVDERYRQIKDVNPAIVVVPADENGGETTGPAPSCPSAAEANAYAVVIEAIFSGGLSEIHFAARS